MTNITHFLKGLAIEPKTSSDANQEGELEVVSGKLNFHDGTGVQEVILSNFTGNLSLTGTLTVTGQIDVDNLRLDGNSLISTDTNGDVVIDPNGTGDIQLVLATGGVLQLGSVNATVDETGLVTITGQLNVDNLRLDGNTISSTDIDGDIILQPNGTGKVIVDSDLEVTGTTTLDVALGGPLKATAGVVSSSSINLTSEVTNVLPIANGGTAVSSAPANGQLLIGNGTGYTLANLTAGSNISIVDAAGSITINASGSGDVVGPASSTDEAIVRFDGTTGKLLQNSVITMSDTGVISGATDTQSIAIETKDRAGGATSSVSISSGDVTSGAFTSGNISISTGAAVSASDRGKLVVDSRAMTLPKSATDPTGSLVQGDAYFNTTSNQIKTYDGATWNASGGSPVATSFTFANNQVSPANVTGFTVNSASNKHFVADMSITRRNATADDGTQIDSFYNNLGTAFNTETVAAAAQTDGSWVVGGTFTQLNGNTRNYLVRLSGVGIEDTAFYTNLGTSFNSSVLAVKIQSDGKILVGGQFTSLDGNTRLKLVRLNDDGTEDTAFYTNLGGGFDGVIYAIELQSDGKIVVGGSFTLFDGNSRKGIVRLNTDGTEDTTFYTNFGGVTGSGPYVSKLTVQSNDKVIVNGYFDTVNGSLTRNGITRLNADGTDDSSFNTNVGTGANTQYTESSALLSDGRIVVVGNFASFNGNTRYDIVCLNSDGTEDTAFYTALGTGFSAGGNLTTVAVNSADQILVSGTFTDFDGNTRNRLIRLNDDGTEDTTFYTNFGGISTGNFPRAFINADDQVLILGDYSAINGNTRNNAALVGPSSSESMENFTLRGIYSSLSAAWSVSPDTGFGDDTGVDFSMTSGGQLQYTSTNISGSVIESVMKFIINNL